jgi:transketolase C-terminal domain/subunit
VATGHLVWEALIAAEQLAEKGISAEELLLWPLEQHLMLLKL